MLNTQQPNYVRRFKTQLEESPTNARVVMDLFTYLDSLEGDVLTYTLRSIRTWHDVRGVLSDYFVHALSTGTMTRDYFVNVVPQFLPDILSDNIVYPTIILLRGKNLLYPEDLDKIIGKLDNWRTLVLVNCRNYLFPRDDNESLTAEGFVTWIMSLRRSLVSLIIWICVECCATVSKSKTEDLIRELLGRIPVEYLFEWIHVSESYILGWMLLAEGIVIRMGEKKLPEYNTKELSQSALDRRDFLMRMMNAEV